MEYVRTDEFLPLAGRLGIGPHARYTDPGYLVHLADPNMTRFWECSGTPTRQARLLAEVLDGMGPWSSCYLWPRGRWVPIRPSDTTSVSDG